MLLLSEVSCAIVLLRILIRIYTYISKLAVSESENVSFLGVIVRKIEGKYNGYCYWVIFAEARE
jgi:hypothetical protein